MFTKKILISFLFFLSTLAGCMSNNVNYYKNEEPKLDLVNFFEGKTVGWGIVQNRSGQVIRRFKVIINGEFNSDVGYLYEDFEWSDGMTEKRTWKLKKVGTSMWEGSADDVIGKAKGVISGNTLKWEYILNLKLDDKFIDNINVKFEDWMFLLDENLLMNQAVFSKFGIELGSINITFLKK